MIAALHPDYSFKFSADYMDANNVQMNESASLKKGKFEYQYSYFDGESSERKRSVCGTMENGKMVFTEEESDSDEGECAFDPEAEYRAFMEELGLME